VLVGISPTPDNSRLHRSALGAQEIVPWSSSSDLETSLAEFKKQGYTIAALEITDQPRDAKSLEKKDFPICLVVGNEVDGLSEMALKHCDLAIEIPQYGLKQSLNVAVATGICVNELIKQARAFDNEGVALPKNPRSV